MLSWSDQLALEKHGADDSLAEVKLDGVVDARVQCIGEKKPQEAGAAAAISFFIRYNGATKASLRLPPHTRLRSALQEVLSSLDACTERDFYLALNGKEIDLEVTVGTLIPCSTLDLRVRWKFYPYQPPRSEYGRARNLIAHDGMPQPCCVSDCSFFTHEGQEGQCSVHFRQRGNRCKVRHRSAPRWNVWNDGLGDVVRIVIQHFVGVASWHEAHSKPSQRIRYVMRLLLLNKAWAASVRASGPHEVSLSGGTIKVRELAVLLRTGAFFARTLQLDSSSTCPGARPQTLPFLLHGVAESLLELKLTLCDVTLCFCRVGAVVFPSLLDLTLTNCHTERGKNPVRAPCHKACHTKACHTERALTLCGLPAACPALVRLAIRAARPIDSVAFVAAMTSLQELDIANADHTLDLSTMLPKGAGGGDDRGQLQEAATAAGDRGLRELRLRWVRGVDLSALACFRSLHTLTLHWCCCLTGVPLLGASTSLRLVSHSNNDYATEDGLFSLQEPCNRHVTVMPPRTGSSLCRSAK